MFVIQAYPKADKDHKVTETTVSAALFDAWKAAYHDAGWVVWSSGWSDYDINDKYLCSACAWCGNYPVTDAANLLCPRCNSRTRVRPSYQNGIL